MFQAAIPVPADAANTTGGLYSFDISFVDQTTQTYYLADRSNKAVDVANAKTDAFVKQISAKPPFAGVSSKGAEFSGPNGVLTARGCIIATDTPSRVVSFTAAGSQVSDVSTGATDGSRADELAFDPKDNLLLVINPGSTITPFGTLISVSSACKLTIGKKVSLPFATAGAEQPQWDPGTQRFFLSIPQIMKIPQLGVVVRINPLTAVVDATTSIVNCGPAGLALNPTNKTLLVGCNTVFDMAGDPWSGTDKVTAAPIEYIMGTDGFVQAVVPGVGAGDEVWFNGGDDHFYAAASSSPLAPSVVVSKATAVEQGAAILGAIDGTSQRLDQLVPTFNVPAVTGTGAHPAGSAHSVAANGANNQVLVPLAANNAYPGCTTGCVAVYSRSDIDLPGATD
ncbi:MAG TPA: hypothetical protein VMS01_15995 [Stellaceae bacterium]|nr:hypothetical protein [Stellaceae bacterium]